MKRMRIDVKTFSDLVDAKYGKRSTPKREIFEQELTAFIVAELIKDARAKAKMTQAELAERSSTKKSYISRIESGKSDIRLSTLFRILEEGLGRMVQLKIR